MSEFSIESAQNTEDCLLSLLVGNFNRCSVIPTFKLFGTISVYCTLAMTVFYF